MNGIKTEWGVEVARKKADIERQIGI